MKSKSVTKADRTTEKRVLVVERKKNKYTGYPLHWHDYYEIQIITGGYGTHIYNEKESGYEPGSAWILSYCDYHGFNYDTDTYSLNICFEEGILGAEFVQFLTMGIGRCNCVFNAQELADMSGLVKQLKQELASGDTFREAMVRALLTEIVVRIIRKSSSDSQNSMPSYVQKVVSYVYKNFRREISLKEIASVLSVSQNHLGVLFRKSMGMSFNKYLNTVRLRYSCNLLVSTDMAIKDIAYSAGYNSVEYFMQVFKATLGITPSRYREEMERDFTYR